MKKLENIKSKIEFDLVETEVAKDFREPNAMQQEISPVTLITILKTVEDIEGILHKKVAYLLVEEAVASFKGLPGDKLKSTCGYDTILKYFQSEFAGMNVADLNAEECEAFLMKFWGESNRNTLIQMSVLLKPFLNWCIKYLKKKGQPLFHNPCDLLSFGTQKGKAFEMLTVDTIKKLILSIPRCLCGGSL
jgi:hypothetical protein